MVFEETYNLFFTNPPKANQREILRTIVLEIKDTIDSDMGRIYVPDLYFILICFCFSVGVK